jgi:hypothetical protein
VASSFEHGSDCVKYTELFDLTGELLTSPEGLCSMELLVIYTAGNMYYNIQEESR